MKIFRYLLVCSLGLLASGCAKQSTEPRTVREAQVEPALNAEGDEQPPGQSFEAPAFATAMERHKPLGLVTGALRPFQPPASDSQQSENERYNHAIAYAAEMESYALLIWKDGALRVEKYFPPHTSDLRPESASMHKSIVGLLIAAAIEDGYIGNVDDPVGGYIKAWGNDPRGSIRIVDLLTMASGLSAFSFEGGANSDAARFMAGGDDIRQMLLDIELSKTPPGTMFFYQGAVTQLLLMVLEEATGKKYKEYLSARLWQPLGADDAYVWNYEDDGFPRAHTAFLARAKDWLRIGLLIKDEGLFEGKKILGKGSINSLTTPSSVNPNYGWQIWLGTEYQQDRFYNEFKIGPSVTASEPYLTDDLVFFDGFGGQRVYISRSKDLVIVRTGALRLDWDDAKLPNLIIGASE